MPLHLKILALVIVLTGAFAAGCARTSRAQPAPSAPPPPRALVTLSGAHSQIDQPTYIRATTAAEFQAVYLRHLGKDPTSFNAHHNEHEVPIVDFDRCMVVAVFEGNTWNTANLFVAEVQDEPTQLIVRVDRHSYQTLGFGSDGDGANRVTPFGFFVMPRSEKEIVIEESVQNIIGRPPVWQECARLSAR